MEDSTQSIRAGEEFDFRAVERYLRDSIPDLRGPLTVTQFPGGHSNLTYLLCFDGRELVLRRPPFGRKAKSAHDMGREYRIQKALQPIFPYCPKPLAYMEDESVIGSPFYVMERIRGIILRRQLPAGLTFSPEEARKLCENMIDVQVELHHVDYRKAGLENFGKPDGYVRRQVEGWSERYRQARTEDAPDCEGVMAWLADKMPGEAGRVSVIHNDYRLDNLVLARQDPMKIVGVLDWEMATIGDPLMDLGGSLAYWVDRFDSPEMQMISMVPTTAMPGALTRAEMIERYAGKMGIRIDDIDFYYVFGLFRLGVIAQQIYYRFFHGQTKDERFQAMIIAVTVLEQTARQVIAASKL
ncbi:MAG: phosphotransferase family protein [Smithellaceae bacterium]|nr:phosphotransferase family protein [Smithellaceae bacterium]